MAKQGAGTYQAVMTRLDELRPHPRNYRGHPEAQVAHIAASIQQHGFYRNVVAARDGTILAGHGVVLASQSLGIEAVPVIKLNLEPDDPRALKVLTSDNELGRFAEDDDRMLSELLREIRENDPLELLGTGYDEKMLAALVMVTRPASEIADHSAAAEWLGMPNYTDAEGPQYQLIVTFMSEADRDVFVKEKGLNILKKQRGTWSTRWPFAVREDVANVRFVDEARGAVDALLPSPSAPPSPPSPNAETQSPAPRSRVRRAS